MQWNLGVNGIVQKGNVNVGILRAKSEGVVRYKNSLAFKTQSNLLYQEFSGYKADNDFISRNYFYYNPDARVYPFSMAYVQSNFRLKIKQHLFYGLGGTNQLLNMNDNVIKCSLSVVNETSKYVASEWNVSNYSYEEVVPKFVQQEDMLYTLGISYLFKK